MGMCYSHCLPKGLSSIANRCLKSGSVADNLAEGHRLASCSEPAGKLLEQERLAYSTVFRWLRHKVWAGTENTQG